MYEFWALLPKTEREFWHVDFVAGLKISVEPNDLNWLKRKKEMQRKKYRNDANKLDYFSLPEKKQVWNFIHGTVFIYLFFYNTLRQTSLFYKTIYFLF